MSPQSNEPTAPRAPAGDARRLPSDLVERVADTGFFMCHHDTSEPPVERVDQPSQVDMKQDAVLTVLRERNKRGEPCLGCEEAINTDAGLAWRAYVRARINFYRARRGTGRQAVRVESIEERQQEVPAGEGGDDREPVDSITIVRRIVRERAPGLSERQVQRVVIVMVEAQAIKRRKWAVMPDEMRAAISRLRKATGLPLDTSLL